MSGTWLQASILMLPYDDQMYSQGNLPEPVSISNLQIVSKAIIEYVHFVVVVAVVLLCYWISQQGNGGGKEDEGII